jgi:beta-lactamase class A
MSASSATSVSREHGGQGSLFGVKVSAPLMPARKVAAVVVLVVAAYAAGFLQGCFRVARVLEAANVASDMSGTWERSETGSVSVLIRHYPHHAWYVLFGAYTDPTDTVRPILGARVARQIGSHGDERDWVLYTVLDNGTVLPPVDVKIKPYGDSHILAPHNIVVVKNPTSDDLHVRLELIPGQSRSATRSGVSHEDLEGEFTRFARGFDGRVGICAADSAGVSCLNGTQRFPLQSVMKLLVALAVMDAVDHGRWRLDDRVVVRKQDLSLGVQPLAKLVSHDGFRTTVDDLVRRAIVDSDSAAADVLVARLGGPKPVQSVIDRLGLAGVRFDRDERHLQTETAGLVWRPEYVDSAALDRAYAAVPEAERDLAFRAYLDDPRDTASPTGMVSLLRSLAEGKLVSAPLTRRLVEIMSQTVTFPDRLKAGVSGGWTLAHKTGTSGTWHGRTAATNDVGILTSPRGDFVSVVVFIADSRASAADRAQLMARVARAAIESYR